MTKKYLLELTEKQAFALEKATDLMTRIGLGQVLEVLRYLPKRGDEFDHREARHTLKNLIHLLGFSGEGESHGIGNLAVPPETHVAYDVGAVLRQVIAREKVKAGEWDGQGVWNRRPLHYGKEPLARAWVERSDEDRGPDEGYVFRIEVDMPDAVDDADARAHVERLLPLLRWLGSAKKPSPGVRFKLQRRHPKQEPRKVRL